MSHALYLIARIAGRAVALATGQIDSVVDLGAVTPAPLATPGVAGLAALRSQVLTVIDPRIVLGLPADEPSSRRAVVARVEGHAYAILVEALEDVAAYEILSLPTGIALQGWAGAGTGMIDRGGEPVLVVDLTQLIPHPSALAA